MSAIGDNVMAAPERRKRGAGGERRCAVTGRVQPKAGLLRFVLGPEGRLVADLDERLPGRGVWLTAERQVLAEAVSGRHFARALRRPVEVPPDLDAAIEAGLARRAADLIGLARRAGAAVAGFEKVRGALASGAARLLVTARDGARHGRAKLDSLARGVRRAQGLEGAELGAVFGRPFTVHVAVTDPAFAEGIERALLRLDGVRGAVAGEDRIPGAAELR